MGQNARESQRKIVDPVFRGIGVTRPLRPYEKPGTRGVYAVVDPRTNEVVYVGSSVNIEARFRSHCAGAATSGKRAEGAAWRAELRAAGLTPDLLILQVIDSGDMRPAEGRWLRKYLDRGQARLNTQRSVGEKPTIASLQAEIARLRAALEHAKNVLTLYGS